MLQVLAPAVYNHSHFFGSFIIVGRPWGKYCILEGSFISGMLSCSLSCSSRSFSRKSSNTRSDMILGFGLTKLSDNV
jgi:hypothetical protein